MAGATPKEAEITIKLMLQKDRNKVIFAEADNNFVDILFSFMTLPLGTIMRILERCPDKKYGALPGIKNVYTSLKDLPSNYFSTDESKHVLLNPRGSTHDLCRKLKLNIDDTEPLKYFICQNYNCSKNNGEYSFCNVAKCGKCGNIMNREIIYKSPATNTGGDQISGGVFVSEVTTFLVTDDLRVMPNTSDMFLQLLCDHGITDANQLEERIFDIGREQILFILKGALLSTFPLTRLVFPRMEFKCDSGRTLVPPLKKQKVVANTNTMTLKFRVQKSTSKFLFAEAEEDFVEFVFGFLGIPLGVVIGKLMNGTTSVISLDNLFASISNITEAKCFKSQDVKSMLCDHQFLKTDLSRNQIFPLTVSKDSTVLYFHHLTYPLKFYLDRSCLVDGIYDTVSSVNLKDPRVESRFLKAPAKFMLMDDLSVTPLSSFSTIALLKKLNVPLNDVENQELSIGVEKGLKLLRASLMSSKKCLSTLINSTLKKEMVCSNDI